MSRKLRIAVVGAGIGGLAAANSLRKRGHEVSIHEQVPQIGEVGAGIQMTPNAVKVMRALGLEDELKSVSFMPQAILGLDYRTGRKLFRTPLDVCDQLYGAKYLHVHRADLHRILSQPLPESIFRLGVKCVDVGTVNDTAYAKFGDGSEVEADVVLGADGIHSVVREKLFGEDAPRFTYNLCWRMVVPFDEPDFNLVAPASTMWFGPNGHIVTYYVKGGKGVNVVACQETTAWTAESWNTQATREEVIEAYKDWHPRLHKLFMKADHVFKWGLFDRDPLQAWCKGNVTILGDAAHPMLPYLSQGAAMAIEDGYVLGTALSADTSVPEALQHYEALRKPRTSEVQLKAREQGKTNHLISPMARLRRDIEYYIRGLINPQATGLKAGWVYEYDATAVA
ncbi:FAD-dependent monooxygenase [Ferrovibrio xuzhouensis]|uniref:FAD-dependent monooxygenase n=1 Tax=Ferrovibrio xuzhouensis TaxID=1576914 RepID=A0ABV7VN97_9PROT